MKLLKAGGRRRTCGAARSQQRQNGRQNDDVMSVAGRHWQADCAADHWDQSLSRAVDGGAMTNVTEVLAAAVAAGVVVPRLAIVVGLDGAVNARPAVPWTGTSASFHRVIWFVAGGLPPPLRLRIVAAAIAAAVAVA